MLKSLTIKNIALIDECEIEFRDGLNILSGETGAGKSIIIDSLTFVLGKKADKSLIRFGESSASVVAEFLVKNPALDSLLDEYGIESEDTLIINRVLKADGAGACRVNGTKITIGMLKNISNLLVDIYGQHENSELLNDSNHLRILDKFSIKDIKNQLLDYQSTYQNLKSLKEKLKEYGALSQIAKNIDILEYQIKEIEEANIEVGEFEKVVQAREKFANQETIIQNAYSAIEYLNGFENENNVIIFLSNSIKNLSNIADFDEEIQNCVERLDSCKIELQDIASTVQSLTDFSDFDENSARFNEERYQTYRSLMKKYGNDEEEILLYLEKIKNEYEFLINGEEKSKQLEEEIKKVSSELILVAEKLSKAREKSAKVLEKAVVAELDNLGMKGTRFEVEFLTLAKSANEVEKCRFDGNDEVSFLIAPNLGQPLKSLSKTISGGELSRFILALKNVVADIDGIATMVFDEIDTGISGKIAQIVAEKLYNISFNKQVLAVTHLPNLASMADAHFLISKFSSQTQTYTKVDLLDSKETVQEIARLIGGFDESEFALPHASEMKTYANNYKDMRLK